MLSIATYLAFTISAAMAAGGIILSSRLRNRFHNDITSALLYFEIFIFTFGFYGIWGQVVIKAYLSTLISAELLTRFTDISMLLGLPFLVFAWLMLVRVAYGISGRKCSSWFILTFLVINFTVIATIGYLITKSGGIRPALLLKIYFISMNFINSAISSYLIFFSRKKSFIRRKDESVIAASLVIIMLMQCIPVYFFEGQAIIGLIVIFTFFVGNGFLPVYFTYGAEFQLPVVESQSVGLSLDEFCIKYDVSPRETDIIREICNGLSNKEISQKLFITVQTVKDHTHRIYIKTNVKSRAQLMNLINHPGWANGVVNIRKSDHPATPPSKGGET